MIFVEMMPLWGHIRINNFYINNLSTSGDKLLIGKGLYKSYSFENKYEINENFNNLWERFKGAIKLLKLILSFKDKDVIFLSYDLIFFPIISLFLRFLSIRIICIEHNTVPVNTIKKIFQKISGRNVMHITYTPYISDIFKKINLSSVSIPHPLIEPEFSINISKEVYLIKKLSMKYKKVIFCPSGSSKKSDLETVINKNKNCFFVGKMDGISLENYVRFAKIECYREVLDASDCIYISFPFDEKVSGPFYETMALGRIAVVNSGVFADFCKKKFPLNAYEYRDDIFDIVSRDNVIEVQEYNKRIISSFKKLICKE